MRRPNRRPSYLETGDISNWIETADYVIYKDDADTVAVNGRTGVEDSRNTNSTTVIKYAVANLPITGGKISILSGDYEIDSTIELYRDVADWFPIWIDGAGIDQTILTLADNSDCDMISYNQTGAGDNGWKRVSNMKLDGNKANNASGHGIYTEKTGGGAGNKYDEYFHDLFITKCKESGLFCKNVWGGVYKNIITEYNELEGISVNGSQYYLERIFAAYNENNGITLQGINAVCNDLHVYLNENRGIEMTGLTYSTFTNIMSKDPTVNGVLTIGVYIKSTTNHIAIAGIVCEGDGTADSDYGLRIEGDWIDVSGFQSEGHADAGLYLYGDYNTVRGNVQDTVTVAGLCNTFNNLGENAGIPGSGGDWAAYQYWGAIVRDTTNNKTYIYAEAGWREISAA